MRTMLLLVAVVAVCSTSAVAAVVTYTLSLNESVTGKCLPNAFSIYATVSQADNFGLEAFAVKVMPASEGGANLAAYFNRSPLGTFEADQSDPDFDPNVSYPTKYAGFNQTHIADTSNGVVAGIPALFGSNFVPVGGFGQTPGSMNNVHAPGARNPPDSIHPNRTVSYGPYHGQTNTDIAYGATGGPLPNGSFRLATGGWTGGIVPFFDIDFDANFASVWTDSAFRLEPIRATLLYQTIDYCLLIPEPAGMLLSLVPSLIFLRRRPRREV